METNNSNQVVLFEIIEQLDKIGVDYELQVTRDPMYIGVSGLTCDAKLIIGFVMIYFLKGIYVKMKSDYEVGNM